MSSGTTPPIELKKSQRYCRQLATSHYENFLVASILLPRRMRQPFYNIYAFCRTADDVADESPDERTALDGLDHLQNQIDRVFAGQTPADSRPPAENQPPAAGLFPALAETVAAYRLDKQPFDDLLSAFRQDQRTKQYETTPQLIDYCSRSANPVGRLVLQLADSLDPTTAALSDEICTGLQLANFWQDISRDHAIGRIYLPADVRKRFGVSVSMLGEPSTPPALRELLAFLCDQAENYFHRGLPLADHVPTWLRSDIKLFAHGGLATLDAIREIDFDVLSVRPEVGKIKQGLLVARALLGKL